MYKTGLILILFLVKGFISTYAQKFILSQNEILLIVEQDFDVMGGFNSSTKNKFCNKLKTIPASLTTSTGSPTNSLRTQYDLDSYQKAFYYIKTVLNDDNAVNVVPVWLPIWHVDICIFGKRNSSLNNLTLRNSQCANFEKRTTDIEKKGIAVMITEVPLQHSFET